MCPRVVLPRVRIPELDELILLALVRLGELGAGAKQLRDAIEFSTRRPVTLGAIYAALDRLESRGLIVRDRAPVGPGRPLLRVHAITLEGRRELIEIKRYRERLMEMEEGPGASTGESEGRRDGALGLLDREH